MAIIFLTLICALVLDAIPLPDVLAWWRPPWTLLTMLFWTIARPEGIGLLLAAGLGLLVDGLYAQPLGLNVFCLITVAFLGLRYHERWRMYPLLQQTLLVMVLVGLVQLVRMTAVAIPLGAEVGWHWAAAVLSSGALWPVWSGALRSVQRLLNI